MSNSAKLLDRAVRDEEIARDLLASGDTTGATMYFDLSRRTFNEATKAENEEVQK